jgi:Uma2 family endonuclease
MMLTKHEEQITMHISSTAITSTTRQLRRATKNARRYPDSDGKPMADNTKQFEWIVTIKGGLEVLLVNEPEVFVAGDLLWYPVEGNNKLRVAPDALVAFGRPKGHRGSYKQWEEGGIAPQVVFEVLSPGNTQKEMAAKWRFYNRYGVAEYYLYDPDHGTLAGWWRTAGDLTAIEPIRGWVSPHLNISFDLVGEDLLLRYPDGKPFASYVDIHQEAVRQTNRADTEAKRAKAEAKRADTEAKHAKAETKRADTEAKHAKAEAKRADMEAKRAEAEAAARRELEAELARLQALLSEMGKKV